MGSRPASNLAGRKIEETNHPTTSQQNTNSIIQTDELGHYTQVVELAGKLDGRQMKVEPKNHDLRITIPKA